MTSNCTPRADIFSQWDVLYKLFIVSFAAILGFGIIVWTNPSTFEYYLLMGTGMNQILMLSYNN